MEEVLAFVARGCLAIATCFLTMLFGFFISMVIMCLYHATKAHINKYYRTR